MLVLSCNIKITGAKVIKFDYVSEVSIVTSLKNLTDTATVVFPRKLKFSDKPITDWVKRGDKIEIGLGYTEYGIETIFKGYIKSVSTGSPLTLECEDAAWLLKQKTVKNLYYEKFNLKSFLAEQMPELTDCSIDDIDLGEVRINGEVTMAQVFDYLMKNYPLHFFFKDGKLYGTLNSTSLTMDGAGKTIKFTYGKNVIAANDLKYTKADDLKIAVVAKHITRDNKKLEVKVPTDAGSDHEVRTIFCPDADNESALKERAEQWLTEYKVDKMEGNFTAFGIPMTKIGDTVHFKDEMYSERNDKKFFVEGVTYTFGKGGYRQKITLGNEIK